MSSNGGVGIDGEKDVESSEDVCVDNDDEDDDDDELDSLSVVSLDEASFVELEVNVVVVLGNAS